MKPKHCCLLMVVVLVLATLACSSNDSDQNNDTFPQEPGNSKTSDPPQESSNDSDSSGTEVANELVRSLLKSLYIGGGGGDGYFCIFTPQDAEFPTITGDVLFGYSGYLCLWGFEYGEPISVELIGPAGQSWIQEGIEITDERDNVTVAQVLLWMAGLQRGQWQVIAKQSGLLVNYSLEVDPSEYPIVAVVPIVDNHVFLGDLWLYPDRNRYQANESFHIFGAGFPANSQFGLGIYYSETGEFDEPWLLIYAQAVETDQFGQIYQSITIEASDPPGKYCVVIPVIKSYQENRLSPLSYSEDGATACFVVEE